jgi:hypothetical protein
MVTVSLMLQHMPSGWTHNAVLRDDHSASIDVKGRLPSGPSGEKASTAADE